MIGERLKLLRLEKKMHKTDIAKLLNITAQSYGLYENEKRSPDYSTLKLMAETYGVSMAYLLGETDIRTPLNLWSSSNLGLLDTITYEPKSYGELNEDGKYRVKEYIELLLPKYKKK